MHRILLILLAAMFLFSLPGGQLTAQRPFERFRGDLQKLRPDGRILREIFGNDDDDDDDDDDEKESRDRQDDRERARSRERDRQTRFQSFQRDRSPTPAKSRRPSTDPSRRPAVNNKTRHTDKLKIVVRESTSSAGLIVESIKKSGAAWDAGIRQGDIITSIGGIKTESREDIDSITGILKDGDQIEFEFSHRGKKKKTLVQLGDLPKDDASDPDLNTAPGSNASEFSDGNSRRPARGSDYLLSREDSPTGLRSVRDASLTRNGTSRSRRPSTERGVSPTWQVAPPIATRSLDKPPGKPVTSELSRLQRELEQKQREIEQIRARLRQATESTQEESGTELDSLFDFDQG